jgi:transcriptional regulator with XRE-family HTH domain
MGQNGNPDQGDDSEKKMRRDLGRRIVKARIEQGLSQVELAKKLGIERSRLCKWELGLHAPLLRQLAALARVLGLSLDELIIGRPSATGSGGSSLGPGTRETLSGMVDTLNQLLEAKNRQGR